MNNSKEEHQRILKKFMNENELAENSIVYRYTSKKYLTENNGTMFMKAKQDPIEMVIDEYNGFGEVFIASEIGQGLAFLKNKEAEYENEDRICVEVMLKDILEQGGLIYEVTSLPAYLTSYFFTLPAGSVRIRFCK